MNDIVQGTQAWFYARCGRVTASRIAEVMSYLKKGGERAERRNYRNQLVCELLTGQSDSGGYLSPYMQHGNEYEPIARAAYEMATGNDVDQVGFIVHPRISRSGASPDGLISSAGGLEIKCPKTETHLRYIKEQRIPPEYEPQMMWGMACTGRQWWDFASFDMRLPKSLQLFTLRLERNEARIAELEASVEAFLAEVDAEIAEIRAFIEFEIPERKEAKAWDADTIITDADMPGWMKYMYATSGTER